MKSEVTLLESTGNLAGPEPQCVEIEFPEPVRRREVPGEQKEKKVMLAFKSSSSSCMESSNHEVPPAPTANSSQSYEDLKVELHDLDALKNGMTVRLAIGMCVTQCRRFANNNCKSSRRGVDEEVDLGSRPDWKRFEQRPESSVEVH